MSLNKNH